MFLVNEPVDRVTDLQHLFSPGKTRLRKELVVCQRLDDSCQKLLDVYSRGDINVSQLEAKGRKGGFSSSAAWIVVLQQSLQTPHGNCPS